MSIKFKTRFQFDKDGLKSRLLQSLILFAILAALIILMPHFWRTDYTGEVISKTHSQSLKVNVQYRELYTIHIKTPEGKYVTLNDKVHILDSWIENKNQEDAFYSVETGRNYTFSTYGWRFFLFEQYPQIVKHTELS